jgi:hypothetical protein
MNPEKLKKMNPEKLKFEKYIPKGPVYTFPLISISSQYINFTRSCFPMLQRKPYCELFYDRTQRVIAIRPTHIESENTLKINYSKYKKSISSRGFISKYLSKEVGGFGRVYTRFKAFWDDKNKCFLIDLNGGKK